MQQAGDFRLRTKTKLPFTLVFSSVGFKARELEVSGLGSDLRVALTTETVLGNQLTPLLQHLSGSERLTATASVKVGRARIRVRRSEISDIL